MFTIWLFFLRAGYNRKGQYNQSILINGIMAWVIPLIVLGQLAKEKSQIKYK